MNDFLQLVNARQSDRAYDKSRLVEADKLERILEVDGWHLLPAMPSLGGSW